MVLSQVRLTRQSMAWVLDAETKGDRMYRFGIVAVLMVACTAPEPTEAQTEQQVCSNPGWHACLASGSTLDDLLCQATCSEVAYCGRCAWWSSSGRPNERGRWVSDRGLTSDCPQFPRPLIDDVENMPDRYFCMSGRDR